MPNTLYTGAMLVIVEAYTLLELWGHMVVIATLEAAAHTDTMQLDKDGAEVRLSAETVRCKPMDAYGLVMLDTHDDVIYSILATCSSLFCLGKLALHTTIGRHV